MIRRLLRQVSVAAVMSWSWRHRGSVVRSADLVAGLPARVRLHSLPDAVIEAKAIARLDPDFASDVRVRLETIADGQVTLRDGVDPAALGTIRRLLQPVGVLDVRTDVAHQPTVQDALVS